jgi:hypothetical protein
MEIAILAGLALLGHEISKDTKTPRSDKIELLQIPCNKRNNKFPFEKNKLVKDNFELQNQPFFTERKVASNNVQKQRRMESFTGTDDNVFWKKKQEVENLFKPSKNLSYMNGIPSSNVNTSTERYAASLTQKMDGISPIEKINVGKGLNKGNDIAASGGFHDSFRILPDNINSYKKNSFAGRINTGKSITTQRNHVPHIESHGKPSRFYTEQQRQAAPGKSQFTKQQHRGKIALHDTTRGQCTELVHLGAPTIDPGAPTNITYGTRNYDSSKCNASGNPHMQVLGNNPQSGTYIMPQGERENCGTVTNAHYSGTVSSNRYNDAANPTLREDTNNYEGQAYNSQVNAGGHLSTKYTANPTMREDANNYEGQAYNSQYQGNGNNSTYTAPTTYREETGYNTYENAPMYNNGQSNRKYESNPTQRQSTHSSYTGAANSNNKAYQNQQAMRSSQPYAKREEVQREFIPGGSRMNVRENATQVIGSSNLQNDCNSHPVTHGVHNQVSNIHQLGNIEVSQRNNVNNRNDFGLAKSVLRNNCLARSVAQ